MTNLTIIDKPIRQLDGLYSLNDLHKASGGLKKHQPSDFTKTAQTKELIAEIEYSGNSRSTINVISSHKNRGTWVCKELVYAYAMWISAKFHLQVIRAFDALQQAPAPQPEQDSFTVSGNDHLVLQKKYIHLLEQQNQTMAAQAEVSQGRATFDFDAQRFERFAARVKNVLREHGTLNKTQLLAACGYAKDDKTARQLLDFGTNTHWFCMKRRNVYSYALDADSLGGAL